MKIYLIFYLLLIPDLASASGSWRDYFPLQILRIAQDGMHPNYNKDDLIFIKRGFLYSPENIKRGQIVAFNFNKNNTTYIFTWRTLALGGDKLTIEPNGAITINGKQLTMVHDTSSKDPDIFFETNGTYTYKISLQDESKLKSRIEIIVPSGHIYLLGDNRNNAYDSRYHGPVHIDSIFGTN